MKARHCIAVFDSGVGGLSLLPNLRRLMPDADFVYCCDNAFHPYGLLAPEILCERVTTLSQKLYERFQPDLLIIACNTASTIVLTQLRSLLTIPVVGMVPAIKPAAQLTKTGHIGLLATEATVKRPYTDQLIRDFAPNCTVVRKGSQQLVAIAEAKLRGAKVEMSRIKDEISIFFANDLIDVVVLGCSHFSHLISEFTSLSPRPMIWLDSSEAVATRAYQLLSSSGKRQRSTKDPETIITYTTDDENFSPSVQRRWTEQLHITGFSLIN